MRVAVFCPNFRSLYTLAVAWQLHRDGHEIGLIVVRRMVTWPRVRQEWKAGASKLVAKVVRRGLRLASTVALAEPALPAYCRTHDVPTHLPTLARRTGARVVDCNDFAAPRVLRRLRALQPEAAFFTGGGMLRQPVLDLCGHGVVNCHIGPLPAFRGMDVVEWPLLCGTPCALTCHLMDAGLDTGPILFQRAIPVYHPDTLARIRTRVEPLMVEGMRDAARGLQDGSVLPKPQARGVGKQYYSMHPRLVALVQRRLEQR